MLLVPCLTICVYCPRVIGDNLYSQHLPLTLQQLPGREVATSKNSVPTDEATWKCPGRKTEGRSNNKSTEKDEALDLDEAKITSQLSLIVFSLGPFVSWPSAFVL